MVVYFNTFNLNSQALDKMTNVLYYVIIVLCLSLLHIDNLTWCLMLELIIASNVVWNISALLAPASILCWLCNINNSNKFGVELAGGVLLVVGDKFELLSLDTDGLWFDLLFFGGTFTISIHFSQSGHLQHVTTFCWLYHQSNASFFQVTH